MSFSNYTAQAVLNSVFGKTSNFGALASAPTIYVALSTTAPAEDGSNVTEPVGNNYARVATAAGDWNAATLADPSLIDNSGVITFNTASGSWGTITHVALYDAVSGGNFLGQGVLGTSKSVATNDTPEFAAGELNITLD